MLNLLEAHHITKRYANHTALDDVSIAVPAQSIFGLLGPNGAGKTSLIRIINRITGPDSGEVLFEGAKLSAHHTNEIGYLPEERGLYKKMEVGEQVLYLAQLKGLPKKEALNRLRYWFQKFEIEAWWKKRLDELSKGMQQKVQFIATVVHQPKLLILDEPFSGFDPINAALIKNEILELKKQGATIIFSTHNMSSVEELCDYIALINKSKKILDGNVASIRKAYKTNIYEIEYTGDLGVWQKVAQDKGELIEEHQEGTHIKIKIKLFEHLQTNQLLQLMLPHVQLDGFREIVPSMNDIFITKVKESTEQEANTVSTI